MLATPTQGHDHTEDHRIKLLDSAHSVQFLSSLPRLRTVHLKEPKSFLPQLTKITLYCSPGQQLDIRTLRDLEKCRRLGLFYVEQISPSTSPLPCLNELTQVTSLLLHGADCITNDVWQLSGLQNLQILTCSSQQTYWEQLTALTNLYTPVQALRHGLEHLSLLKRLCISAWTLDHIEDILPALHGRTLLTLLCLKYPEAPQEEASFNLGLCKAFPGCRSCGLSTAPLHCP